MKKSILILGGARSGKSRFAQEKARNFKEPVLFVATGEARDEEMRERIEKHKKERPSSWRTLETPTNLGIEIQKNVSDIKFVVIDCITLLINNIFNNFSEQDLEKIEVSIIEKLVTAEINNLVICIRNTDATFLIVSNEVGWGLVPDNRIGRIYRDLLGKANQILAEQADEVYLMVAGIPLKIKPSVE